MKEDSWRWPIVTLGFTFLLAASYLDNLRGPLLPQINEFLNLQYSQSSALISVGNFCSMVVTMLLALVAYRISSQQLSVGVLVIGVIACLLSLIVVSHLTLTIFAAALGTSITLMGSLSNIFVVEGTPRALRGRILSGLHSFYGLGSLFAALAVAVQSQMKGQWQILFIGCAGLLALALVATMFGPKSKNIARGNSSVVTRIKPLDLLVCLPIVLYVLGEVGCSTWLVTYAVKKHGFSESTGSLLLSGFFATIAITRLLSMAFCRAGHERRWIAISLFSAFVFFGLGIFVSPNFLPLVGILGPFFPLYIEAISSQYPANWQTITLISFALMQASMAGFHFFMGIMMDTVGAQLAYLLPCGILGMALVSQIWLWRRSSPA